MRSSKAPLNQKNRGQVLPYPLRTQPPSLTSATLVGGIQALPGCGCMHTSTSIHAFWYWTQILHREQLCIDGSKDCVVHGAPKVSPSSFSKLQASLYLHHGAKTKLWLAYYSQSSLKSKTQAHPSPHHLTKLNLLLFFVPQQTLPVHSITSP